MKRSASTAWSQNVVPVTCFVVSKLPIELRAEMYLTREVKPGRIASKRCTDLRRDGARFWPITWLMGKPTSYPDLSIFPEQNTNKHVESQMIATYVVILAQLGFLRCGTWMDRRICPVFCFCNHIHRLGTSA